MVFALHIEVLLAPNGPREGFVDWGNVCVHRRQIKLLQSRKNFSCLINKTSSPSGGGEANGISCFRHPSLYCHRWRLRVLHLEPIERALAATSTGRLPEPALVTPQRDDPGHPAGYHPLPNARAKRQPHTRALRSRACPLLKLTLLPFEHAIWSRPTDMGTAGE